VLSPLSVHVILSGALSAPFLFGSCLHFLFYHQRFLGTSSFSGPLIDGKELVSRPKFPWKSFAGPGGFSSPPPPPLFGWKFPLCWYKPFFLVFETVRNGKWRFGCSPYFRHQHWWCSRERLPLRSPPPSARHSLKNGSVDQSQGSRAGMSQRPPPTPADPCTPAPHRDLFPGFFSFTYLTRLDQKTRQFCASFRGAVPKYYEFIFPLPFRWFGVLFSNGDLMDVFSIGG